MILWNLVLMTSSGCSTPTMQVEMKELMPHFKEYLVSDQTFYDIQQFNSDWRHSQQHLSNYYQTKIDIFLHLHPSLTCYPSQQHSKIMIKLFSTEIFQLLKFPIKIHKQRTHMNHRPSKSLANLQNVLSQEIAQLSSLRLQQHRVSLPLSLKKTQSSSAKSLRVVNKSAGSSTRTKRNDPSTNVSVTIPSVKLSCSTYLSSKTGGVGKTSSKLKKKGLIVVRPRLAVEQKSLASTKCIQVRESVCDGSCQHSKKHDQLLKTIEGQRRLIETLQGMLNQICD